MKGRYNYHGKVYRYRKDRQDNQQDQRIGRLESTWPALPPPMYEVPYAPKTVQAAVAAS